MKGIAGRRPVVCQPQPVSVADNTGAKVVQILNVLKLGGTMRRYPSAGVGDMAKVSVKKGTPDTRRQMFNAVIIRQRRPFRRVDGTWVQFEDNACVIVNEKGTSKVPTSRDPSLVRPQNAGLVSPRRRSRLCEGEMVKSSKPGKQRKAQANAPQHIKRKAFAAVCNSATRCSIRRCSTTVRVGDTVRVVRGDQAHGGKRHGGKRNSDP